MTRSQEQVHEAFERAVFNVLFHNRDDHPKNVSYRLRRDRRWELAPAYDLSFNEGPGGEHQMTIQGHGRQITRDHLMGLSASAEVDARWARERIEAMLEVAADLPRVLGRYPIRLATRRHVAARVAGAAGLLR
jgi:serine/threonine-protein kinase HipA